MKFGKFLIMATVALLFVGCKSAKEVPYMQNIDQIPAESLASVSSQAGDFNSPGVIRAENGRLNLLEAIALGGDLTIYGRRDNVLLIREDATGAKKHIRINLTDANLINSPYFYLQQNDIIYVEPNDVKKKNSDIGQSTTMWFSFIGIATSLASLIVSVLRK